MLNLKYFAIFDCPFLKNDIFTLCSRKFHCWRNDSSSCALLFGRSKSRIRCFDSAWVTKCGSVVLEDEKSWSSFILVLVPGEASFFSGSESRVLFQVALSLADIYFATNLVFEFKRLSLKNSGWWSNLVTRFGFSNVKTIKIAHHFYRMEFDVDPCN
jgi:hypothetical protein